MRKEYVELVNKFKALSDDEKQEEILNNINQLLKLLYLVNKKDNSFNEVLPIINKYENESEYYDVLYTYIISLKEETAKLINNKEAI